MTQQRHESDTEVRRSINSSKQEQIIQTPKKNEVVKFFIDNNSNEELAHTFFNHNNSFSWTFKGTPILNWQSFALNYIKSSSRNNRKVKISEGTPVGTSKEFGTFKNSK
jgi:hypothetical protein